tara:strand:+ start:1697 stop:2080 length:384 start_codon:yes stop_codon:yes gene_type:complete
MSKYDLAIMLNIVERKQKIDQEATWSNGSATYLAELKKEIVELEAEIGKQKPVYLEDELGDVLWDYLNLIACLTAEEGISIEGVLARASRKYEERIAGIEQGRTWKDIKADQKLRLLAEDEASRREV